MMRKRQEEWDEESDIIVLHCVNLRWWRQWHKRRKEMYGPGRIRSERLKKQQCMEESARRS